MITPRDVRFKIPKCEKKYWFNDDPVKTLHANALTSGIPYGERYFVVCILSHMKKIKNKALKKDVVNFIKQELNHAKAHYRLYLKAVKPHYPKLRVRNCLYQKIFMVLALLVGHRIRLATVAAIEHYTAVSGEYFIQHEELTEGMDDTLNLIFQWHFIEEIEHKAVAYDILQETGQNYFIRMAGFILGTFFITSGFLTSFLHMVRYDKLYKNKQFYQDAFAFFIGKKGILRALFFPYLRYIKPYFHPNQCSHPPFVLEQKIQELMKRQEALIVSQTNGLPSI